MITDTYTVYPSEIVADFYKRCELRNKGAVLSSQFLSWDVFCGRARKNIMGDKVPIKLYYKYFFCSQFLRQNPSFSFSEQTMHANNPPAMLEILISSLPRLPIIQKQLQHLTARMQHNLHSLYVSYQQFLDSMGFYEPDWHMGEFSEAATLFLPDLQSNYDEHRSVLEEEASITLQLVDQMPAADALYFYQYNDAYSEIEDTMEKIELLLDQGTKNEDIVITVASLEKYRDTLASMAAYYEIPISFHASSTIAQLPEIRLFMHLEECYRQDFAVETLQELILDPSLNWKDAVLLRRLLSFGKKHACTAGIVSMDTERWKKTLLKHADTEVREKFWHLYWSIRGIIQSKNFSELRKTIQKFSHTNLHIADGTPARHPSIKFTMSELNQLESLAINAPRADRVVEPWKYFLYWLKTYSYAPPHNENSIAVYSYGVSAGMFPKHHFILNCSQQDSIRRYPAPIWIREELQKKIGMPPQDLSEIYVRAYCRSGQNVTCSYAVSCFGEPRIPQFFIPIPVEPATVSPSNRIQKEMNWWMGHGNIDTLNSMQKEALAHQEASGLRNIAESNYRHTCIGNEELRAELASYITIYSPTMIDRFLACPFSFLWEQLVNLRSEEVDSESLSHMTIGQIYHAILRDFFLHMQDRGQELNEETWRDPIITELVEKHSAALTRHSPDDAVQKEKIFGIVPRAIQELASCLPNSLPWAVEQLFTVKTGDYIMEGKIDLVLKQDKVLHIVDYKKKGLPANEQITGKGQRTVQLPMYAYLLQRHSSDILSSASYYSLEDGEFHCIASMDQKKNLLSMDEFILQRDEIPDIVADIHNRIQRGDYRCNEDCSCSLPALSRSDYVIQT